MKVGISRLLLEQILSLAAADSDEVCGLLLGQGDQIHEVLPAANVAPEPSLHFEVDPTVLIAAHRRARSGGWAILGHYHSHPSGFAEPSATDAASASPEGNLWLIIGTGEARLWKAHAEDPGKVEFIPVLLDVM